ncbi:MAG TPA: ChrR family anti-sigma-E factor [Paracoccaceae bacterium]|nr:ChrR family anti-sigma-E factor [Paracoccaceae bacterium]
MENIRHHIPEELIAAYVSGRLPHPYAIVVASHVSMCTECRVRFEAHSAAGGAVLDDLETAAVSPELLDSVLELLDLPENAPEAAIQAKGVYPAPVMEVLGGNDPKWRSLGTGAKQSIIWSGKEGSARLLLIPAGQAMPNHTHNGLELTLVLQGSFSDDDGQFATGDVEVADQQVKHTPIADPGPACICLAATDAPLRFSGIVPRLFQPIFRI